MDSAPVSLVATVPNVIVTQPALANTMAEFIAAVKAKPGAYNFGSGGSGTSNHLAGELFNIVAGTKLVHVPYKGVNLAMQDVLAGSIHLVVIGVPAAHAARSTSASASSVGKLSCHSTLRPGRVSASHTRTSSELLTGLRASCTRTEVGPRSNAPTCASTAGGRPLSAGPFTPQGASCSSTSQSSASAAVPSKGS